MPSINVYISEEMKARMDKAGASANWSAIAQRAFDLELKHLEAIKEIGSMTDVIERLSASKEEWIERQLADGRTSGREWARKYADYDELRRLALLKDAKRSFLLELDDGWESAVTVLKTLQPDEEPGADTISILFGIEEEAIESITADFVDAFLDGAWEVWEEVSDKI